MSVWKMIAADYPLPEIRPEKEHPLEINIDKGTIFDGDADDNFMIYPFRDSVKAYTDMEYGATLEWVYYTEGRGNRIIEIIETLLQHTDKVELWNFWLGDLDEYERPIIKVAKISFKELRPKDIEEWDSQIIWPSPSRNGDRPTFYCLKIIR